MLEARIYKTCCSESAGHLVHTWICCLQQSLDSTSTAFNSKAPKCSYGLMVHAFRNIILLRVAVIMPCQSSSDKGASEDSKGGYYGTY